MSKSKPGNAWRRRRPAGAHLPHPIIISDHIISFNRNPAPARPRPQDPPVQAQAAFRGPPSLLVSLSPFHPVTPSPPRPVASPPPSPVAAWLSKPSKGTNQETADTVYATALHPKPGSPHGRGAGGSRVRFGTAKSAGAGGCDASRRHRRGGRAALGAAAGGGAQVVAARRAKAQPVTAAAFPQPAGLRPGPQHRRQAQSQHNPPVFRLDAPPGGLRRHTGTPVRDHVLRHQPGPV